MIQWDSAKFQLIQCNYLALKLADVQAGKIKKLDSMITTLSNEKQILESQFHQELDLYIGNNNANVLKQMTEADESQIEAQMQQHFKSVFGAELNHDETFYAKLEELNDVLSQKVEEAKNIEPLLLLNEKRLQNYTKYQVIQKDIDHLEYLADLAFLSEFK